MKIVCLTSGTRGDVQPYVALGAGLKKAGYQVTIAGSENFEPFITSYGLDFFRLMGDITPFLQKAEALGQLKASNPIRFFLSFREMGRAFRSHLDALQHKAWEACQGADAILFHPGLANGHFISHTLGIPGILASPIPLSSTSHFPSIPFFAAPRLGGLYNRLTHALFQALFWGAVRPSAAAFWKSRKDRPSLSNPYRQMQRKGSPILYGFSRHVLPPPPDWTPNIAVTGYWFPEEPAAWTPSTELLHFLEEGSPPIYVGFGSIRDQKAEASLQATVKAIRNLGRRALVSAAEAPPSFEGQRDLFFLQEAPHTWLFPKMAAVIHHGGAGTTGAGLAAGVPSLIMPHSNDQPMWGRRIADLGVGLSLRGSSQTDPPAIQDALSRLFQPSFQTSSQTLADAIRAENGVPTAVALIQRLLQREGLSKNPTLPPVL